MSNSRYLETLFADFLKRNLLRLNELDYTIFSTINIISISLKNKRKTSLFPLKSKRPDYVCHRNKKMNLTQIRQKNTSFFLANPEKKTYLWALIEIHKEI